VREERGTPCSSLHLALPLYAMDDLSRCSFLFDLFILPITVFVTTSTYLWAPPRFLYSLSFCILPASHEEMHRHEVKTIPYLVVCRYTLFPIIPVMFSFPSRSPHPWNPLGCLCRFALQYSQAPGMLQSSCFSDAVKRIPWVFREPQ